MEHWFRSAAGTSIFTQDRGVLLLYWRVPCLDVIPQILPATSSQDIKREAITDCHQISEFLKEKVGRAPKSFDPSFKYSAIEVGRQDQLELQFCFQTDFKQFMEFAREELAEGATRLTLAVSLVLCQKEANPEVRELKLALSPACYPPAFQGAVAIDLGNTNTILAALDFAGIPNSKRLKILDDIVSYSAEALSEHPLSSRGGPVLSVVRIDAVFDPNSPLAEALRELPGSEGQTTLRDKHAAVENFSWRIGKEAHLEHEGPVGLIISPKRLVTRESGDSGGKRITVRTRRSYQVPASPNFDQPANHSVDLPTNAPAELFVCRLLQLFRGRTLSYPARLAVTYPTTYSSSELAKIRHAVYRGWQMAEWLNPSHRPTEEELIPLSLDEATAAAFFYLSRRVLDGPGSLHTFRWLFPNGFHLLVYDLGGATLDFLLVRIIAPASNRLQFVVLGRSGLRTFGGDDITVAVFLLLKAKLAEQIARALKKSVSRELPVGRAGANPAAERRKLAEELRSRFTDEDYLRWMDQLVPTDFDRGGSGVEVDQRKAMTLTLWVWAEEIKKRISAGKPIQELLARHEDFAESWLRLNKHLSKPSLLDLAKKISISQLEIDALIEHHVRRSIRCCQGLLRSRLGSSLGFVDDVFLVGNGAQYPLIQSAIREALLGETEQQQARIGSLLSGHMHFHSEDLKNAVAKGAALALAYYEAALGVIVTFDSELSRRLPFRISWYNAKIGRDIILFEEGSRYEDLQPKEIEAFAQEGGEQTEWVRLRHCWPGAEFEGFLTFKFSRPVKGKVVVSYDRENEQFVASAEEVGEQVVGQRDLNEEVYIAPPQRVKVRLV